LSLLENRAIDESALARLGSRGLLRSSNTGLQVVLGPIADQVAGEIRDAIRQAAERQDAVQPGAVQQGAVQQGAMRQGAVRQGAVREGAVREGAVREEVVREARLPDASAMLAALGGRVNVADIESQAGRVLVRIADPRMVDEPALRALGIRGVARSATGSLQLLIPGSAEEWAQPLRQLLA
jgi:PTS system N-acetylglucosamine-specific IIC component